MTQTGDPVFLFSDEPLTALEIVGGFALLIALLFLWDALTRKKK